MILGMSSVSFGKDYVCSTDRIVSDNENPDLKGWYLLYKEDHGSLSELVVSTEENDTKLKSVFKFGSTNHMCRDGHDSVENGGMGKSIRVGDYLLCTNSIEDKGDYPTSLQFILNLKTMTFRVFDQNVIDGNWKINLSKGKCEEV